MIEHPQLKAYQIKPQALQYVEIIKVQINTRFETSWEGSCLGDGRFRLPPRSDTSAESLPSRTANL